MWRRRRCGGSVCKAACMAVALGAFIILALVLPGVFWWFALGVALIVAGLYALKSC